MQGKLDLKFFAAAAAPRPGQDVARYPVAEFFSVRPRIFRSCSVLFFLLALNLFFVFAHAANTPCSGRKGGVSHCAGETFICNDGSVSASRKNCSAYMGQASGDMHGKVGSATADCACRGHMYCTGPRGGRYCLTDDGKKSYLRR